MKIWTRDRRQSQILCFIMVIMCSCSNYACLADTMSSKTDAASATGQTNNLPDSTGATIPSQGAKGEKKQGVEKGPKAPLSLLMATTAPNQLADSDIATTAEAGANKESRPKQILRTGVNLNTSTLSPNSRQLAEDLHLMPILQRIQKLRGRVDPTNFEATVENLATSQQLTASTVMAMQIIEEANLAIDFVIAEINAEENIYNELLSTFSGNRDKTVFKTNAVSFITNGILWAVAEGLDVPTNKHPNYSISSGTFGILAGIVPSIASILAMYQLNGKKELSERDPNMLSKVLGFPITNESIEYPQPVWDFLKEVPASGEVPKSRKDQLIDRWVSDKNIPNFTDRSSSVQLDIITANGERKKGLSISTLNARQALLQQLSSEILKMKRMLYELSLAVRGAKTV